MKILLIQPAKPEKALGGEDFSIFEPLALEYLAAGNLEDAYQTLRNLSLLQVKATAKSVFRAYLDVVLHWQRLQSWLAQPEVREAAVGALWG